MTGYIIVGIIMTVAIFVFVIMAMMKAASISDAVTERYMESVKEKNGGLQKKKENCYIKCKECKKIFCTEEYDMASYKYRDKLGGRYIYFCSYNCMMRYKREKGQYKDNIIEEKYEVEDVKPQNKRENVLRVYSPSGVQF